MYLMTLMDPLLLNLLAAAERGEKCPPLVVVTGTWVIQGALVGTTAFLEASQTHVYDKLIRLWGSAERKNPMSPEDAAQIAGQRLAPLGISGGAVSPSLSLIEVTLTGVTTLSVPAMRVPLAAIDAWWVTDHAVETQQPVAERGSETRGGGGVSVGVAFGF